MPHTKESQSVFFSLKSILKKYEKGKIVVHDTATNYYLDAGYSEKWKKVIFFGAVSIKKNYVSFYYFPVYMFPDLLAGISPELKKHMQGKSCFNFKEMERKLFVELAELTKRGAERARREKTV